MPGSLLTTMRWSRWQIVGLGMAGRTGGGGGQDDDLRAGRAMLACWPNATFLPWWWIRREGYIARPACDLGHHRVVGFVIGPRRVEEQAFTGRQGQGHPTLA